MPRLDVLLVEKGLVSTRAKAQALIVAGKVQVNGKPADKAGHRFAADARIEISGPAHPFVSRGGVKLDHALDHFAVNVNGLVCMDVGASTGGFTDCLLKRGAKKVYAVDVGYGQLDWRLRNDERVVVLERTNIRYLKPDAIKDVIDIAAIDVSFISLKLVVPAVLSCLGSGGHIIALVKPQFEVGRTEVGKGGVVRDPGKHKMVLRRLETFFQEQAGLKVQGVTPSPLLGPKGNREFLMLVSMR